MTGIPLPIANGFYQSASLPVSAQECVNGYPNITENQGLSQETVFGTPGLTQKVVTGTLPTDENRGSLSVGGVLYVVNGGTLYEITSSFTATNRGSIAGTGRVSMAENGSQLMILVPGATSTGYIYTPSTTTLATIASGFKSNGEPQHVVFVDGYFVCTTDSKNFICSNLNNGIVWDATDVGTAETDPDDTVVPAVLNNQLFIFGSVTAEAFDNIGGPDFPFLRSGLYLDKGVSSPFTMVRASNSFLWVGKGVNEDAAIWMLRGTEPVRVSTDAIDALLDTLSESELESVWSWSYGQRGVYFVGFNLPNTTLVYDLKSELWHERKSRVTLPGGAVVDTRWRVNSIEKVYGTFLVGDSQDGTIGELDPDVFTEYGNRIFRSIATQPFQNNMTGFVVPSLELTIESGMGNADEPDPKVSMSRSLDGKTFTPPRERSAGKIGEYGKRQIWTRVGKASRFEVFKFEFSGKSKFVVIQLTADIRSTAK